MASRWPAGWKLGEVLAAVEVEAGEAVEFVEEVVAQGLRLQKHAALAQRVVIYAPLPAKTDPLLFDAMLDHGLAAAAASAELIPADARVLIRRVTRGIRQAACAVTLDIACAEAGLDPEVVGSHH